MAYSECSLNIIGKNSSTGSRLSKGRAAKNFLAPLLDNKYPRVQYEYVGLTRRLAPLTNCSLSRFSDLRPTYLKRDSQQEKRINIKLKEGN